MNDDGPKKRPKHVALLKQRNDVFNGVTQILMSISCSKYIKDTSFYVFCVHGHASICAKYTGYSGCLMF
jgi:hypothetical protein